MMRSARRAGLGILVAVALAGGLPLRAAPADDGLRHLALQLVNEARAGQGLAPLRLDDALNRAAQAHADDMLKRDYFAHASPEGDSVRDRYRAAGGAPVRRVAENLGRSFDTTGPPAADVVRRLHDGWMQSPGHRENILRPNLDRFGFGFAARDAGSYAVQTFAGP